MDIKDKAALLEEIARVQEGDTRPLSHNGTDRVIVQIGYIGAGGMLCHDGILLVDAPAAIVAVVMKWVDATNEDDPDALNIMASMYNGGLLIR